MINVLATKEGSEFKRIEVFGHSGYDVEGKDIVCASVSSALCLTVNALLEIALADCEIIRDEEEARISLEIVKGGETAQKFVLAFINHIKLLKEDYPKYICLKFSEV